jgi:acyl-CoA synthetase (AMP-forming)/AMP-acid ligase II
VHPLLLLDMAASVNDGRTAIHHGDDRLTYGELLRAAWGAVAVADGAAHLAHIGPNGVVLPVALYGAAADGIPFIPLNHRLPDEQLHRLLSAHKMCWWWPRRAWPSHSGPRAPDDRHRRVPGCCSRGR